jgi:phosphoglycolate phosphatase-like HAD superfamily hydrolase
MATAVTERLGIAHHFDLVQGSDSMPNKPDPVVLTRVLRTLEKRAGLSWMVGDTVYDIEAGKAAGMRTCAVTYGIGIRQDLEATDPDLLVDSLADLPGRIGIDANVS